MTVRSHPSSCRLQISPPSAPGEAMEIVNQLGVPIERVAIGGRDGKFYWAGHVAAGAKARAEAVAVAEIRVWLRRATKENQPANPPGMDASIWNEAMRYNRYRYYYPSYTSYQVTMEEFSTGKDDGSFQGSPTGNVYRRDAPVPPRLSRGPPPGKKPVFT